MKLLATLLATVFLAGCSILPLKPGRSSIETDAAGHKVIQVHQSQNPKDSTVQDYKRVVDSSGVTTEEVHTKIGAAQKDTAREVAAKLSSLKGIVWLGVLVFLFGVFSAFNPYLKAVVGSVTTSAAIAVAGLLLVVLPTLIVGNEILILGGTLGAAALWFLAHRHGHLRGQVTELLKK